MIGVAYVEYQGNGDASAVEGYDIHSYQWDKLMVETDPRHAMLLSPIEIRRGTGEGQAVEDSGGNSISDSLGAEVRSGGIQVYRVPLVGSTGVADCPDEGEPVAYELLGTSNIECNGVPIVMIGSPVSWLGIVNGVVLDGIDVIQGSM